MIRACHGMPVLTAYRGASLTSEARWSYSALRGDRCGPVESRICFTLEALEHSARHVWDRTLPPYPGPSGIPHAELGSEPQQRLRHPPYPADPHIPAHCSRCSPNAPLRRRRFSNVASPPVLVAAAMCSVWAAKLPPFWRSHFSNSRAPGHQYDPCTCVRPLLIPVGRLDPRRKQRPPS
jgi:hypothetical protein